MKRTRTKWRRDIYLLCVSTETAAHKKRVIVGICCCITTYIQTEWQEQLRIGNSTDKAVSVDSNFRGFFKKYTYMPLCLVST